ncbi:MAG: rod shape-determining protein MreC [Clostridia bacterium]|nr:rod shape-determining protein MreC [Clostridia bacterium]
MAKHHDKDKQRRKVLLPDPDDFYFDDDLDSVTRGLPTESDYLPAAEEEAPQPPPMTEGIGRAGVRMFGLPADPVQEDMPEEEPYDGDPYGDEEDDPSHFQFIPAYDDDDDDDDEPASGIRQEHDDARNAQAEPIPVARSQKRKTQKRVIPEEEKTKSKHPRLRIAIMALVTVIILGAMGMMLLSRTMYPDNALLSLPERAVSGAVGPVQSVFSGFVEYFADYFRTLKLRSNLEQAYVDVVTKNEELAVRAAMADEYARRLAQYEDIDHEIQNNLALNPLRCQVIGAEQGNYFSTFTIDAGSRQGIEEYMAVTIGGALVGYTEEVYETTSTVRAIIDSNASIAGLIQSSRDQGTVRGTLGVDGQPMCRMYYLPDDHLPRPGDIVVTSGVGMSFPKGIPIGTVRESTRGMEANKQYIVVEPEVDFEHLEFVIVLRYKPAAEAVQGRESTATYNEYVPTVSARPYPTLRIGTTLRFGETATPIPTMSVTPTPSPTPTPKPTATPTPRPTSTGPVYEYSSDLLGPTPTPTATPTPSPTPVITLGPDNMTWEEE